MQEDRFLQAIQSLMRPPGGGIPVYSAGVGAAEKLQIAWYKAATGKVHKADQLKAAWLKSLAGLKKARVVILGVPLDTGAGIRRGAAYGPRGVREALLKRPSFVKRLKQGTVLDLGDIFTNPHLLHDEMLNADQIVRCRAEMYPSAPESLRDWLPVSALSQLSWVLDQLAERFPHLKPFVIGGDHSVAWPVSESLAKRYPGSLGIVQPDAHTDLLSSRLGVKYCFGTWSFHANELLKGAGKMVQLGIRQTGRDRGHWETSTGVRQFWADELRKMKPPAAARAVADHLRSAGVKQIYFSNDIDGTDEKWAAATGTPADRGLSPELVLEVIRTLSTEFEWVAADLVEVAPHLGPTPAATRKTLELSAKYAEASIEGLLAMKGKK